MRCGSDCSRCGNIKCLRGAHVCTDACPHTAQDRLRRAIRHGRRSALLALSAPVVFPYGSWLRGLDRPKSSHRGKRNGTVSCAGGRERPQETFWAAWPQKSGVAPARFSLFSTVTFPCIAFCISFAYMKLVVSQ